MLYYQNDCKLLVQLLLCSKTVIILYTFQKTNVGIQYKNVFTSLYVQLQNMVTYFQERIQMSSVAVVKYS
jgi:hypothetical protein